MAQTLSILIFLASFAGRALAQGAPEDPFLAKGDQAAALLGSSNPKDALAMLEPLLRDPALAASPQRDRLHYYAGCAAVAVGDDSRAGRFLSRLAPFEGPVYSPHARYLLARIHHRAGERTEAEAHYLAVPPSFDKQVAGAKQALQNAQALKDKPAEKARLEALVKGPPPDFLLESVFYLGVLFYEQKAFLDALPRFMLVVQKEKRPAWVEEARLRAGMCQVRLNQGAEAIKVLQPLQDQPRLGRAARWWMARAAAKPAEAGEHLKKAWASAEGELGPGKVELLLALGAALDQSGRPAESVEVYKSLQGDEALARLAGAHAAAKQYREAVAAAAQFEKQFPASPFLPDVLLRRADVSFAEAQAAGKPEQFAEAIKGYERVLGGATGATANAARYRMAVAQVRLGKFADALASLRAVPDGDRTGELAGASTLHAECILRGAPPAEEAADALSAAQLLKDLQEAAGQLQKSIGQAGSQAPEVNLKLGHGLKQIATLLAEPQERMQAANSARELYERFRAQYPNHPMRPVAEYERANCYALAGDPASAIQKLERFRAEPFASAPVAPLALLRQAQLYRAAGQAPQPLAVLAECRPRHEAALQKDPARAAWIPLLRYHHAVALKAAKQGAEAAKVLESVVKDHPNSEWAEPSSRLLKEVKK